MCPGEKLCALYDEESAHQLTVKPVLHNGRMLMALVDLAVAMHASDGNSRSVIFTSTPLPHYDGYGLPDEYRAWLLERTFTAHQQNRAVVPLGVYTEPALSDAEKLKIIELEVIRLVNLAREEHRLQLLDTLPSLDAAAQLRSEELKINMPHTRPCESSPSTAYADVPYDYSGETIQKTIMSQNLEASARAIMSIWMGSDGHKANILKPDIRFIGVGASFDDNGRIYIVQGFVR